MQWPKYEPTRHHEPGGRTFVFIGDGPGAKRHYLEEGDSRERVGHGDDCGCKYCVQPSLPGIEANPYWQESRDLLGRAMLDRAPATAEAFSDAGIPLGEIELAAVASIASLLAHIDRA